jgi:xanthine dehydrogenase accessory factor
MDIFQAIMTAKQQGKRFVLATVIQSLGSAPREAGARMLIFADGTTIGTIGGGAVEKRVMEEAQTLMNAEETRLFEYDLDKDLQMKCGGQMSIFLEPMHSGASLIIFGAGHIGQVLCKIASILDFQVTVVDNRPEFATSERLPLAQRIIVKPYSGALEDVTFTDNSFIVIVTHGHAHDQDILEYCSQQPFRYLGVIGSRNKAQGMLNRLREKGVAAATIESVHCPIGLDIGANTPEEIAIAIAAEMIAVKNNVKAASLKMTSGD